MAEEMTWQCCKCASPLDKVSAEMPVTLLRRAAFSFHPAWSGCSDYKWGSSYSMPERRAKTYRALYKGLASIRAKTLQSQEHPIALVRHAVRMVEEASHLQDGNMKEVCPTWGGMGQCCLSQQRGSDEVVTKHLYATSDLFHGVCPCTSSSNGANQHLLRASFGAETGINSFLLLFKTQQHSYKVWTIIPTFQMRKLRLNKLLV